MESEHSRAQDGRSQGDVVALDHAGGGSGPSMGVIINADCDLAHGKTDGTVAYLPIYTFREYLEQFWLPGHVRSSRQESVKRIVALTQGGETGPDDLETLLGRFGADEGTKRLCGLPGVSRKGASEIAEHVRRSSIAEDASVPIYERFERLCAFNNNPRKYARGLIERAHKDMSDGHLFVSEIVGRPEIGFVIRMRRIYSIPEDHVFTSTSAQLSSTDGSFTTAVRVARLTPRYRYKLLQLFAQQFSRIGLDDEVTALSSLAIDDLVSNIGDA